MKIPARAWTELYFSTDENPKIKKTNTFIQEKDGNIEKESGDRHRSHYPSSKKNRPAGRGKISKGDGEKWFHGSKRTRSI